MTTDTEALTYDHIVALALERGFKLKPQVDGRMALNDYVIDFARAVYDIGRADAKAETADVVEPAAWMAVLTHQRAQGPQAHFVSDAKLAACDLTYDALKTIPDAIRAGGVKEDRS